MNTSIRKSLLALAVVLAPLTLSAEASPQHGYGKRGRSYTPIKIHDGYRARPVGRRGRRVFDRVRHTCNSSCRVIPGRYEYVHKEVWVPAHRERVWIEPVYEDFYDTCGTHRRRLVREGHWKWVHEPGYFETIRERVWVPGRVECRFGRRRY